jgi:hypothetical protein
VRNFALTVYEKPKPSSDAVVIELDEMWHFLGSKTKLGSRKSIAAIPVNLLTGNAETEAKNIPKNVEPIEKMECFGLFSNNWFSCAQPIPPELLAQTKSETYKIEENNAPKDTDRHVSGEGLAWFPYRRR